MKFRFQSLLFVIALAGVLPLHADEPTKMYIWTKDGNKTTLPLSDKPQLSFTADEMSVSTSDLSISLPFAKLDKITYSSQDESAVPEVRDDERQSFVIDDDGSFVFQADSTPLYVLVTSTNGMLLKHFIVGAGEWKTIPAEMLPSGNYMVVVNGVTYKIAKL